VLEFGDGGDSLLQNPTHDYNIAGTYTVNFKITNDGGFDWENKTNYIIVHNLPPTAVFSADDTIVTTDDAITFTDASTGLGITTWLWEFGDGDTSALENPTHTYSHSGTFTVVLTVTNDGGSDVETKTNYITVTTAQNPDVWKPNDNPHFAEFFTENESGEWTFDSVGMVSETIDTYQENTMGWGVLFSAMLVLLGITITTRSLFSFGFGLFIVVSNIPTEWCPIESRYLIVVIIAMIFAGILIKPFVVKYK